MKLTEYKPKDIAGFHDANVFEQTLIKRNGKIVGAYFPETNENIKYLIDYIAEGFRANKRSLIPHGFHTEQIESIFFGGLRTDGSLGRHKCMLSVTHKDSKNSNKLKAVSLLGELGVKFVCEKYSEFIPIFENQKKQQSLLCDENVCITNHFTSGSVNYNGLLEFHRDIASLPNVFNLIFYKRQGKGGNLILPELDLCIDSKSYSLALLNVKDVLHGVSSFEGFSRDSVVYYSINGMGK
jgi:hypothetical protein